MNRLITAENLALIMSKARVNKNISQKEIARRMNKSIGTVQNWESGASVPNLIDLIEWFNVLSLNPLSYILAWLYPDTFNSSTDAKSALLFYINNIAPESEINMLAYCMLGNTGSSLASQLNMLTAHNHTSMKSRVNVGRLVLENFEMEQQRGELINTDSVMPDILDLKFAIDKAKIAALHMENGYCNC